MDYYFVCVCGIELFVSEKQADNDNLYCSECGEPIPKEELIDERL
jgi:hypothetical protein